MKSSSPSPSGEPCWPEPPPPFLGFATRSPAWNCLLPGATNSRLPVWPSSEKDGSLSPFTRALIGALPSIEATPRERIASFTASRSSALARRTKRWRLPRLRLFGFRRRSMMGLGSGQPAFFTRMYQSTRRRTWRWV